MAEAKRARRMALVAAAGGVEPLGTGSPCADCGAPRTALNTGVCWSDAAKTRLTFKNLRPTPGLWPSPKRANLARCATSPPNPPTHAHLCCCSPR